MKYINETNSKKCSRYFFSSFPFILIISLVIGNTIKRCNYVDEASEETLLPLLFKITLYLLAIIL